MKIFLRIPLLVWSFAMVGIGASGQTAGTLDATFDPLGGASSNVYATIVQPDGKILIAGEFTTFNGLSAVRVVRINTDGTQDITFSAGSGANLSINAMVLQPDGKIIVAGNFTTFDGQNRQKLARLNSDGSLDNTFTVGSGANSPIYSLALQDDGKILIGGAFTTYANIARGRIARINADGSLDATFTHGFPVGTGANDIVRAIAIRPDGKVLIAGDFITYNGLVASGVARLLSSGFLDATFSTGTGLINGFTIFTLRRRADEKMMIGGNFLSFNGIARSGITRLNEDGSVDLAFDPGTGINGQIRHIDQQPDGQILASGSFTLYDGTSINRLMRIHPTGMLDTSFDPQGGPSSSVYHFSLQVDGRIVLGGQFINYNGISRVRVARVHGCLEGCTDPLAVNFNPAADCDDGTCSFSGCMYPTASNYEPLALIEDGSCVWSGCMDVSASNFNPFVTFDNGSCQYSIPGCTYEDANNFNPAATLDDGSCTFNIASCPGDLNNDQFVNFSDLTTLLSNYNNPCP